MCPYEKHQPSHELSIYVMETSAACLSRKSKLVVFF